MRVLVLLALVGASLSLVAAMGLETEWNKAPLVGGLAGAAAGVIASRSGSSGGPENSAQTGLVSAALGAASGYAYSLSQQKKEEAVLDQASNEEETTSVTKDCDDSDYDDDDEEDDDDACDDGKEDGSATKQKKPSLLKRAGTALSKGYKKVKFAVGSVGKKAALVPRKLRKLRKNKKKVVGAKPSVATAVEPDCSGAKKDKPLPPPATVVFSDVEGLLSLVNEVEKDTKELFDTTPVQFVYAGDMFDPKPGKAKQHDVVDKLHSLKASLVYGNRDLNKLRFLTESSEEFLDFLDTHRDEVKLKYIAMRVYYWVIMAKRQAQRKPLAKLVELLSAAIKQDGDNPKEWRNKQYHEFLAANTLGCKDSYSDENQFFSDPPDELKLHQIVHKYFSSNKHFRDLMEHGSVFQLLPHGCGKAPKPKCTVLVSHSGLADYDLLSALSEGNPDGYHLQPDTLSTKNAIDPYHLLGGVFHTVHHINNYVNVGVKQAFSQVPTSPSTMVAQLKSELHAVSESFAASTADIQQLFDTVNTHSGLGSSLEAIVENGIAHLKTLSTRDAKWEENIRTALQFFAQPLERGGDQAIDGSLPYALRSSPFRKSHAPGITSNNPIQYYGTLQLTTMLGKNAVLPKNPVTLPELMMHVCQVWKEGLRVLVLGHIAVPGPLVMRFTSSVLEKTCDSGTAEGGEGVDDFVVAFVDQSGYGGLKADAMEGSEAEIKQVKFSYFYQSPTGQNKFRFATDDIPVEIDLTDGVSGLLLPVKPSALEAMHAHILKNPTAGNDRASMKTLWQSAPNNLKIAAVPLGVMQAVQKFLSGVVAPVDWTQVQLRLLFTEPVDELDDLETVWLHASVDIGAPFRGSKFFQLKLQKLEVNSLKLLLKSEANGVKKEKVKG